MDPGAAAPFFVPPALAGKRRRPQRVSRKALAADPKRANPTPTHRRLAPCRSPHAPLRASPLPRVIPNSEFATGPQGRKKIAKGASPSRREPTPVVKLRRRGRVAGRDGAANTSTQREQVSLRVSRTHSLARRASIPPGLCQHKPSAQASEPFSGLLFRIPHSEFRIRKRPAGPTVHSQGREPLDCKPRPVVKLRRSETSASRRSNLVRDGCIKMNGMDRHSLSPLRGFCDGAPPFPGASAQCHLLWPIFTERHALV